ncbi:hypothetical protein [Treponema endosymbiont of Eucomonympha sp.]|uniref:hypothetical protein n=1 Tax=Treponema endosymbiont of Eucomonympha sp. TaxID=1580831 RepID=UPI0013968822|nr:hypothetical protein [Treponema endosymbiont of Eucomonympha sp.]
MKRKEGIHRHDISDEARERIKKLLPGQAGKHGGAAKDSRLFINAAEWQTVHGRSAERHAARIREPEQHA